MTEPIDQLFSAVSVSQSDPYDTFKQHPRFAQYKSTTLPDQHARRHKELERQKRKRVEAYNLLRHLEDETIMEMNVETEDGKCQDMKDTSKRKLHKVKSHKPYADQIMLSEWLSDKPLNFESDWITVICPIGRRSLVIANRGRTAAYSRKGSEISKFSSALPGGSIGKKGKFSVLDCIYCEQLQTFFIIDLMCWNGHPIYDSDYTFRSFWLRSKIEESYDLLSKISETNRFKFIMAPVLESTPDKIFTSLNDIEYPVDGLLFYHKDGHYKPGEKSSLVNWLKPHMIPEMLGYDVPERYQQSEVEMKEK